MKGDGSFEHFWNAKMGLELKSVRNVAESTDRRRNSWTREGTKEQLSNRVRFIYKLIRVVLRWASWRVHVSTPPVSATWPLSRAKTVLLWRPEFPILPSASQFSLRSAEKMRKKREKTSSFSLVDFRNFGIVKEKKFRNESPIRRSSCCTKKKINIFDIGRKKNESKDDDRMVLNENLNSSQIQRLCNYYNVYSFNGKFNLLCLCFVTVRCTPAIYISLKQSIFVKRIMYSNEFL